MIRQEELSALQFYATAPYACSYLDDRLTRSQVVTTIHSMNAEMYSELVRFGFRRSGEFIYRPHCDNCSACIPIRIRVDEFQPNRSQRRASRLHSGLIPQFCDLDFVDEHYALYQRYQRARHSGSGMDQDSRDQYQQFLLQSYVNTRLVEFRDARHVLKMVSLIDGLNDGYSSVYTFFDPDESASFGTYNIVWQIGQVKKVGLPYLYLGYWIKQSRKMSYKSKFRPFEVYIDHAWIKP